MDWKSREHFRSENLLFAATMVHRCQYTLVQTHRMYTPRLNRNVNNGLWVIMTCQCRFLNHKKWTTLVGDVDNRKDCTCVETGGMWEVSTSPKFCCKPKTALKKKKLEIVEDRGAWCVIVHGFEKSQHDLETEQQQQKNSSDSPPWMTIFLVRILVNYGFLLNKQAFRIFLLGFPWCPVVKTLASTQRVSLGSLVFYSLGINIPYAHGMAKKKENAVF